MVHDTNLEIMGPQTKAIDVTCRTTGITVQLWGAMNATNQKAQKTLSLTRNVVRTVVALERRVSKG